MSQAALSQTVYVRVTSSVSSTRTFELNRFPAYIGTDSNCAVHLDMDKAQEAIAGKHAQLLRLADGRFRLVNLTEKVSRVPAVRKNPLAQHDFADLAAGDCIEIGAYSLQLQTEEGGMPAALPGRNGLAVVVAPHVIKSKSIDLTLTPVGSRVLKEGGEVAITIYIQNVGDASDVKFDVEVIGIEQTFIQPAEGPILNPGSAGGVTMKVKQPAQAEGKKLPAGTLTFGVRVSAPPYREQPAVEVVTLEVQRIYRHEWKEEL